MATENSSYLITIGLKLDAKLNMSTEEVVEFASDVDKLMREGFALEAMFNGLPQEVADDAYLGVFITKGVKGGDRNKDAGG